jgi:hypothetical protein
LISVFGKFAGEKQHWQAAKIKIVKNRAPKIPDCTGRHTQNNQAAGNGGRSVPTLTIASRRRNEPDRREANCHVQRR